LRLDAVGGRTLAALGVRRTRVLGSDGIRESSNDRLHARISDIRDGRRLGWRPQVFAKQLYLGEQEFSNGEGLADILRGHGQSLMATIVAMA
jgi:hypothetical protein